MVLKTTLCRFSGLRIYPGRGVQFVHRDGTVMLFIHGKARSMYFQRKKAANLAWTTTYRRAHKKDQSTELSKRKRRNLNTKRPRAIVGTSVEEIQKRRQERPDVRAKARELAVREIKDRMKKAKGRGGRRQQLAAVPVVVTSFLAQCRELSASALCNCSCVCKVSSERSFAWPSARVHIIIIFPVNIGT
eukprot:TRINITY_DN4248_c0_g1_i1.p1 TRINITY_DN4248_c0_g1~~TRINITY_DN4248_c0_g1_i1.p1  ORF type:complete len:189 (+),score=8.08 TRINITY_DN4248_c0_g1_i1:204-770(+)